jgi:hypothetical protein
MDILWDDAVYPFIEISDVVQPPYRVSNEFIEAVKDVIDRRFPRNLRKEDGTKILVIEKDTAIMGDLFFDHVDQVSRQLFDLSPIQEKFYSPPVASGSLKKYFKNVISFVFMSSISLEIRTYKNLLKMQSWFMVMPLLLFNLNIFFSQHQHLHFIDNFIIAKVDCQRHWNI